MLGNFLGGLANLGGISAGVDDAQLRAYRLALQQLAVQQAQQQRQAQGIAAQALSQTNQLPQQTTPPSPFSPTGQVQQQPLPPLSGTQPGLPPGSQLASAAGPGAIPGMGPVTPLPQSASLGAIPGLPPGGGTEMNQFPISAPSQTRGGGGLGGGDMPVRLAPDQLAGLPGPSAGSGFSAPPLGNGDTTENRFKVALAVNNMQAKRAGAPAPAVDGATKIALDAGGPAAAQQWGQAQLHDMMAQIDKVAPDAPPAVKFLALQQMNQLLAPNDRMMLQYMMRNNSDQIRVALKEYEQTEISKRQTERETAIGARQDKREQQINARAAQNLAERQRMDDFRIQQAGSKLAPTEQAQIRALKAQQQRMNLQAAQQGGWQLAPDELRNAREAVDEQIQEILDGAEKRAGAQPFKPPPPSASGPGGAAIPPS